MRKRISCATSQSPSFCAVASAVSAFAKSSRISGRSSAAVQLSESVCSLTAAVSAFVVSPFADASFISSSAFARSASRTFVPSSTCALRTAMKSRKRFASSAATDGGTFASAFSTVSRSPDFAAFHTMSDQRAMSIESIESTGRPATCGTAASDAGAVAVAGGTAHADATPAAANPLINAAPKTSAAGRRMLRKNVFRFNCMGAPSVFAAG